MKRPDLVHELLDIMVTSAAKTGKEESRSINIPYYELPDAPAAFDRVDLIVTITTHWEEEEDEYDGDSDEGTTDPDKTCH